MRRRAFTLIELLVVVATISILAGLIFSVLKQARSKAESVNCLSNLRQMQTANLAYAQDNRGFFVCIYFLKANGGKVNPWMRNKAFLDYFTNGIVSDNGVWDYYAGNKVIAKLLCPTVRNVISDNSTYTKLELSYGYNTQNFPAQYGNIGARTSMVGAMSRITFLDSLDWEITNDNSGLNNTYLSRVPPIQEGVYSGQTVAFRHSRNANVVLGDGSGASRTYAFLRDNKPTANNAFSNLWNP